MKIHVFWYARIARGTPLWFLAVEDTIGQGAPRNSSYNWPDNVHPPFLERNLAPPRKASYDSGSKVSSRIEPSLSYWCNETNQATDSGANEWRDVNVVLLGVVLWMGQAEDDKGKEGRPQRFSIKSYLCRYRRTNKIVVVNRQQKYSFMHKRRVVWKELTQSIRQRLSLRQCWLGSLSQCCSIVQKP